MAGRAGYQPGGPYYPAGSDLAYPGPTLFGPNLFPLQQEDNFAFGQAQATIVTTGYGSGQCQADILANGYGSGQCQATIRGYAFGQCQADIKATGYVSGQCQADIKSTGYGIGQCQADIKSQGYGSGQCQATIQGNQFGQAQGDIKSTGYGSGQCQADIKATNYQFGQAQGYIPGANSNYGQCQADIKQTYYQSGQCQADIKAVGYGFGQSQADILANGYGSGQCQATIQGNQFGQAQGDIKATGYGFGQCQADIKAVGYNFGQAQADIKVTSYVSGQSQAEITLTPGTVTRKHGQAQARIQVQVVLDTFSRTEDMGVLGTPDIGPAYEELYWAAVADAFTEIEGSELKITFGGAFGFVSGQVDINKSDQTGSIEFSAESIDELASSFIELIGAGDTGFNHYAGVFIYTNFSDIPGQWGLVVEAVNPGYEDSSIDTPYLFSLETNVTYILKYIISGPIVKGKIWKKDEEVEPDWQVSLTHSSNNPFPQGISYFYFDPFSTTIPNVVHVDNYNVFDLATPLTQGYGQAQASIRRTFRGHAQALATIVRFMKHGQAQGKINAFNVNKFAQAQAKISKGALYGQALADIKRVNRSHGLARAQINQSKQTGQAQADIRHTYTQYGQARAFLIKGRSYAQAAADIKNKVYSFGNALAYIHGPYLWANAQALIRKYPFSFAQSMASIQVIFEGWGQAMATVTKPYASAQCQAYIVSGSHSGQAQADIRIKGFNWGQCQALIRRNQGYGQAQAAIKHSNSGQAQGLIRTSKFMHGLALGLIVNPTVAVTSRKVAQAQAYIRKTTKSGQAQGVIKKSGINSGQANALIARGSHSAQAQALIDGKRYLVSYNGKQLPGYAQSEALDSVVTIQDAYSGFHDGSLSEYYGLQNKIVSLTLKTIGTDLADNKDQIQEATTILRSKRDGFTKFYVQRYDRYYLAIARDITSENDVRTNKTAQYTVSLETKPWLLGEQTYTISGTGLVQTVGRTTANGGWSPVRVRMTGQDITISGYTATNSFTGYVSVSGIVTDLMVNSEAYSATIGGVNRNDIMDNVDYALFVGPETTYFDINGATECVIEWEDRWYL